MPAKGRPRLTLEDLQSRVAGYCARYQVRPKPDGLPPFPSGKRETPQHREWLLVYKAHQRLSRRLRGRCERCDEPAEDGSIFCLRHRDAPSARASAETPVTERGSPRGRPAARCPACGAPTDAAGRFTRRSSSSSHA